MEQPPLELAGTGSVSRLLGDMQLVPDTSPAPARLTKSFTARTTSPLTGLVGAAPMHDRALMHNSLRRTQPASFSAVRCMHFDEDLLSSVGASLASVQAAQAALRASGGGGIAAGGLRGVGALFTRSVSGQLPPDHPAHGPALSCKCWITATRALGLRQIQPAWL